MADEEGIPFDRKVNELLLAQGYYEVATYSFISPSYYDKIDLPAFEFLYAVLCQAADEKSEKGILKGSAEKQCEERGNGSAGNPQNTAGIAGCGLDAVQFIQCFLDLDRFTDTAAGQVIDQIDLFQIQ